MVEMQAFAVATEGQGELFKRPCADCGRVTTNFCIGCRAAERFPREPWVEGQMTPLCRVCDDKHNEHCHFCRGVAWCTPPPFEGGDRFQAPASGGSSMSAERPAEKER